MNPFVQIKDVRKAFKTNKGEYVALRDINLDIAQGEFVAFIGHSGCGKSTLLNMIAGLYTPTSGSVKVDGREIKAPGSDRAMVFQNYSLLPWMSVSENVFQAVDSVYEKNITGVEKRELSDKFIEMVGLGKHKNKLPGQLSGGMKQRAAIARAFATKPEVLLLDEPFGALDALTKGALHDELLDIWNESAQGGRKQTIFMVTHDIDEAIYLCDRIVVFTNGPAATIGEVIEVPIPRPRDKRSMSQLSIYGEIKARLIELLTVGSLGSHKKERESGSKTVRVGFIPLTDCAPIAMVKELELDFKYGFKLEPVKSSSWAAIRDGVITGDLDAAHCLWSLPMSVASGVTQPAGMQLPIAMTMACNGQAITLSNENFPIPFGDLKGLKNAIELLRERRGEPLTFGATYTGGTHGIWLRTLLDKAGVSTDDYRVVTIPPPQMVLNLQSGVLDGFSVGEPWNGLAAQRGAGWTFQTSQDIWPDHPEKALVTSLDFANNNREALKALMKAVLEACLWLDDPKNLDRAAQKLAKPEYVGAAHDVIKGRMTGEYHLGGEAGTRSYAATKLAFSRGGTLNAPKVSYARWFFERYAHFGLDVAAGFDAEVSAQQLVMTDLYAEVIAEMNEASFDLPLPVEDESAPIILGETAPVRELAGV